MRIIAGEKKGRKLVAPEGLDTRPTTERIKESIFNIVQFDIPGRTVLDLYAGSGQLGIEALSRGAEKAVFVDHRADSVRIIKKNLEAAGLSSRAEVVSSDVPAYLQRVPKHMFGLVFLDPPYGGGLLQKSVLLLSTIDILAIGGIILCESAADDPIGEPAAPYRIKKEYFYGKKKITTILRA